MLIRSSRSFHEEYVRSDGTLLTSIGIPRGTTEGEGTGRGDVSLLAQRSAEGGRDLRLAELSLGFSFNTDSTLPPVGYPTPPPPSFSLLSLDRHRLSRVDPSPALGSGRGLDQKRASRIAPSSPPSLHSPPSLPSLLKPFLPFSPCLLGTSLLGLLLCGLRSRPRSTLSGSSRPSGRSPSLGRSMSTPRCPPRRLTRRARCPSRTYTRPTSRLPQSTRSSRSCRGTCSSR